MQLDKTRVAVRERGFYDVLDLALLVIREHAGSLLAAAALGVVPVVALNVWLFHDWVDFFVNLVPAGAEVEGSRFGYLLVMVLLIAAEAPLATAPITLYLGQAMFQEKPSLGRVLRDLRGSLGQLLWGQVMFRLLLISPAWFLAERGSEEAGWILIFTLPFLVRHICARAYLNEIILLERNPWQKSRGHAMSTTQRAKVLHATHAGDLFARWLGSLLLGSALIASIWLSIHYARGILANDWEFDVAMWNTYLQVALWAVVSYFTVVRFLSYLDLRIRIEGWEIELRLRAEGARLASQLA